MTTDELPCISLVDVVIPAWGSYVEQLPRAVASVTGATVTAVVGPSDAELARSLGCIAVTRPPGGIGPARNTGAAAGQQPFVLFLDADDEVIPGAMHDLLRRMHHSSPEVLAVAGELQRRSNVTTWPPRPWAELAAAPGLGPLLLWRNVLPAVGATLIRRSALPPGGLFPDLEDEDWHAVIRLRSAGRIDFRRRAVLRYSDRPGSVSRRPRDPEALERSHSALVLAAASACPRLPWRMVEVVASPLRRRARQVLIDTWGRTTGATGST